MCLSNLRSENGMTLRQIKHIHTQHPNPRTIIMLNVRFILPLRLSTILEIKNEFNQFICENSTYYLNFLKLTDQLKYFLLIEILKKYFTTKRFISGRLLMLYVESTKGKILVLHVSNFHISNSAIFVNFEKYYEF